MTKITGTSKVWLSDMFGPQDIAASKGAEALRAMSFVNSDMSAHGYALVGTANIVVELVEPDQMIASKVESLRKEITKTRADAEMKARGLEEKVQQLLAITNEVKS